MLVLRAGASNTARLNLATVGHVLTKQLSIFVIDVLSILFAELAILATRLTLVLSSHVSNLSFGEQYFDLSPALSETHIIMLTCAGHA